MPRDRATVRDVAAETGVSIATVSRVLNQQGSVAPETRGLVERAVDELGAAGARARAAVRRSPSPAPCMCAARMCSPTTSG